MQRRLKETEAQAKGLGGASQAVSAEARKIESAISSRGPVRFLGIDVVGEKRAAAEVVDTARQTVNEVRQATSKFDPAAFWSRQTSAASASAKAVETETKRAAAAVGAGWLDEAAREERLHANRARAATRATSTVVTDAKTGARLTQAELAKITGTGARVVEAEAKRVGAATGSVLGDLRKLFLQNNFLFRQLGQRAAGDLGFAAAGVGKLALNFSDLAKSSGGATAELEGAASGALSALGAFGPLGAVVVAGTVALTALAVATGAAVAGLFLVAKSVSDAEEHFDDLSRQTGLSTDNLQVLDIVARQSGSTLDKLVGSVGQLQRKLIDASENGSSRLSVGLRKLGIDADDPNKALGQLVDLLGKLPAGTVRTGAAMQIFGRGGREVAGVIDQIVENVGNADGALDRLKKQFTDAGVHIDRDGTATAGRFHDQLILVEAQLESVKRIIGEEALPVVLDATTRFSDWLARNRTEIVDWAKEVEHGAEKIIRLAEEVGKLAALATAPIRIEIDLVRKFVGAGIDEANRAGGGGEVGAGEFGIGGAGGPAAPQPLIDLTRPPEGEFAIAQGRPAATTATDDVAKRIRDAFAQRARGGGGGRKGEDPAEIARRLADISLQETVKGLTAEREALQRSLDLSLIARDKYTQDAINLELKRRQATIDGLKAELAEAENIRKPGQRAVKVAEINARIREEERRSSKEVTQITDDSAAEQLRIGQALADSQLRIVETQTAQVTARIRELADFREVTETEAAHFEEQQILRVFNARERILLNDRRQFVEGSEKYEEITNQLNQLDAERNAALEAFHRQARERFRQAAEFTVQFAAQIRDAFQRAADVQLEAGEANLEPLRNSILTRHQLWDAELRFEIEREDQRHDAAAKGLEDEAALARIRIVNAKELAATLAGINAQSEAEETLHQAKLNQLATQAAEQRRQELLRVADDLTDIAGQIFDAIGTSSKQFWTTLTQTASNFAKQIGKELFKGLLEKGLTGQAQGAEGLIGAIINPILGAGGPHAAVTDNTKATKDNTTAINALTQTMGGSAPLPTAGGLSGVLQFLPNLLRHHATTVGTGSVGGLGTALGDVFGGSRASGGPAEAGKVYRIHDHEFFRPNVSGQILNLQQANALTGGGDVRLNVAVGQDAVDEMVSNYHASPKGKRDMLVRAKANRKVSKLRFA